MYIRGHSRNQPKGGRNSRNVTPQHAFLTIFSANTQKESRSRFKFYVKKSLLFSSKGGLAGVLQPLRPLAREWPLYILKADPLEI